MKTLVCSLLGIVLSISLLVGCSSQTPQQQSCTEIALAACALQHDPTKDQSGFNQCAAEALVQCNQPSPTPTPGK